MRNLIFVSRAGIWAFLMAFSLVFLATFVHAQTATTSAVAQRYHFSFPVVELGNCNSLDECKAYCNEVANQDACTTFAKSHGFYKVPPSAGPSQSVIAAAKTELGCNSAAECKQFCSQEENRTKCEEFAQKYHLGPPPSSNQLSSDILQRAQQILGCSTADECKTFCSEEANHQKCADFAQTVGLQNKPKPIGQPGSSVSGQPKPPTQLPSYCRDLAQRFGSSPAGMEAAKVFYQRNCVLNNLPPTASGGGNFGNPPGGPGQPIPTLRPSGFPGPIPPLSPTGVQGISAINILEIIKSLFGVK